MNMHTPGKVIRRSDALLSADSVDFSGGSTVKWILSVGYAQGPDDLAVLVARREAAPLAAEGLDEEKTAAALPG